MSSFNLKQLYVLVLWGLILFGSASAHAICVQPKEPGKWVNVDANTNSITKVNVSFQCQDLIVNGELFPPGDPFNIHLYGKCHPTDCDWGEFGFKGNPGGWLTSTIDQGFAKRYAWVKITPGANIWLDRLRVYIWTDFTDPSRKDYATDQWFKRKLFIPSFPIGLASP